MKKIFSAALITITFTIISCNKNENKGNQEKNDTASIGAEKVEKNITDTQNQAFDINSIPVTDKLTGEFPYFKLPENYEYTDPHKYHGEGETRSYDKEYFYNKGVYTPMEGKTFKAEMRVTDAGGPKSKKFEVLEIQKNFDNLIADLGGVKINNGDKLKDGEKDRLKQLDPNAFASGYLHSCNNSENVHTYVIRKPKTAVWVQYNLGSEQASITILETAVFTTELSIIPSSEIKKELDSKGKAVLNINFDVDKSSLTSDGSKAVQEIFTVLNENPDLKLSVEGHTDNSGNPAHNKELSENRANTVKDQLVKKGIDKQRLNTAGFGSEKPIASNDSEDGRFKNRRVELLKIK